MKSNLHKLAMCLILGAIAALGALLRVTAGLGSEAGTIYLPLVYQMHSESGIAPPALKWQRGGCYASWCETGWYSSPAVVDLDGDGTHEVIASAYSIVALDGK